MYACFHLMWFNEHNHSKRQNIVIHMRRRLVSGIMRAQAPKFGMYRSLVRGREGWELDFLWCKERICRAF